MTISIANAVQSTWIFIGILIVALFISARKKQQDGLSVSVTEELKGFAILAVIFAHVGYILVSDTRFLFPLSIFAGVGVSLFLFLSGYGLTKSSLKNKDSILSFYKKRLIKLFLPFWIVISTFLILDYFVLNIQYTNAYVLKSFFGIFTQANAFSDLNSPLWYFTLILIYYILFPLVFFKKYPWISAISIGLITLYVSKNILQLKDVSTLYKVHLMAFPLGMICAWCSSSSKHIMIQTKDYLYTRYQNIEKYIHPILIILLQYVIGYTAIYSGVGKGIRIEQFWSLVTMFAIICLFILKKFEFRLLSILGIYSYEIYLIHWPLMNRYDILYKNTPAWLATVLYLVLFLILGWILRNVSDKIRANIKMRQNSKI